MNVSGNFCRRIKSWVKTEIATHKADIAAHHAKYTNTEAVSAMGAKANANPLHHDKTPQIMFSSRISSYITIPSSTWTVPKPQTENFDIGSFYDSATGKFQPNIEGYYLVGMALQLLDLPGDKYIEGTIRKVTTYLGGCQNAPSLVMNAYISYSTICYLNGSSDYLSMYVYHNNAVSRNLNTALGVNFWGILLEKC